MNLTNGESHLQRSSGTSFLDVISGNRDRVELRHVLGGVLKDVSNDAHAGLWRVDVGVAHHELLEDVVLDSARELLLLHALLFGSGDKLKYGIQFQFWVQAKRQ